MDPKDYVTEARAKGMSDNAIRTVLTNMGYSAAEIDGWLGSAQIKTKPAETPEAKPAAYANPPAPGPETVPAAAPVTETEPIAPAVPKSVAMKPLDPSFGAAKSIAPNPAVQASAGAAQAARPAAVAGPTASPAASGPNPAGETKPLAAASISDLLQPAAVKISDAEPVRKSHRKILPVLIGTIVFILLAGGGAFAYVQYFAGPSPAQVLYAAAQNEGKISSMQYSGQAVLKMDPRVFQSFFPQSAGTIALNLQGSEALNPNQGEVSINISEPLSAGLDFMYLGGSAYLRVNGAPKAGTMDFSALAGKWIKIDNSELTSSTSSLPVGTYLNSSSTESFRTLTSAQRDQLKNAALSAQVLSVSKVLPDDNLDGPVYHYQYAVSKDNFLNFYKQAEDIVADPEKDANVARMKLALAGTTFLPGEIWIGKNDLFFRKAAFSFQINSSSTSPLEYDLTMAQSHINEPLSLTAPTSTISLDQALGVVYGEIFKAALASPSGAKVKK